MSYLNNVVKKAATKKQAAACGAVAAALALSCAAVPAFAAQTNTGNSNTDVYLTVNADAQLSVTAPTEIDYVLEGDGAFTCPDSSATQITNNSVVPVAVKSYAVADQTGGKAKAVAKDAFAASTDKNAWWNNVSAKAGAKAAGSAEAALNLAQATLSAEWNMGTSQTDYNGTQGNVIDLTTSGAMKNIDGNIDFSAKTKLAQVTWTFGTGMNA